MPPPPRRPSDRYACLVETKIDWEHRPNWWMKCASPFYGRTRIESRRKAVERVAALTHTYRPAIKLRVKCIRIHGREPRPDVLSFYAQPDMLPCPLVICFSSSKYCFFYNNVLLVVCSIAKLLILLVVLVLVALFALIVFLFRLVLIRFKLLFICDLGLVCRSCQQKQVHHATARCGAAVHRPMGRHSIRRQP